MRRLFSLLLFSLLLVGCDSSPVADDGRMISGVDLDVLFAPPTDQELSSVLGDWKVRDTTVRDLVTLHEEAVTLPGGVAAQLRIYSHSVAGVKHVGAVIVPNGATAGTLPAVMYLHGGDAGVSVDEEVLTVLSFFPGVAARFVYVIPSFRAEAIRFKGQTYASNGPASPWDYDVDDAMALLSVAIQEVPEVNPDRIGAIGLSRGGGVAMLMGIRDRRLDEVVSFFGPTDFFGPFVQDVTEEALRGAPRDLPGLDYLNRTFITPLGEGRFPIDLARVELVRRSPVLFAHLLPDLQIHHGTADTVVPVSQAESMIDIMARLDRQAPQFEAYLYEGGVHNPLTMDPSLQRAGAYLSRLLPF